MHHQTLSVEQKKNKTSGCVKKDARELKSALSEESRNHDRRIADFSRTGWWGHRGFCRHETPVKRQASHAHKNFNDFPRSEVLSTCAEKATTKQSWNVQQHAGLGSSSAWQHPPLASGGLKHLEVCAGANVHTAVVCQRRPWCANVRQGCWRDLVYAPALLGVREMPREDLEAR